MYEDLYTTCNMYVCMKNYIIFNTLYVIDIIKKINYNSISNIIFMPCYRMNI